MTEQKNHTTQNKKSLDEKIRNLPILNIVTLAITLLTHISFVLLVIFSYKYYGLSKQTFICVLGIIVCLLLICDLLLFVGNNYRDKTIRIINCVLASILLIGSCAGVIVIGKINNVVGKVIDNSGVEQYEKIAGVFVSYDKEYTDLKEIEGLNVGILLDNEAGTGVIAKETLEKQKIECEFTEASSINDLFFGLIDGKIDIAVMPASYRQMFENNENGSYDEDLEKMYDFYSFEEKKKVAENEKANIDISAEPFNILLIGFAQNDEKSPYGLSDTIIVATVNPQTMTVTLTSIARDSYVPISCYGGGKDKINAARGTSRACLIDTVSDLLDLDIDFYMEVNFQAIVDIVDALDGIMIDSPVEFVGQSSSLNRGEMTVLVTKGPHPALGEEALAFARERHAMPGGDFDRQLHQQQVIKEIARKLIELRDVKKALKIMEACGDNISTNLSISQLTQVFNYIISRPNYLDVSQFEMIDIQNMRVTGYSSSHYNEQLGLALWIYKLYQGSIDESLEVINNTMGNFDKINQTNKFYFFSTYPYDRGRMYSLSYSEAEVHETLPLTCPNFVGMTYDEAVALAAQKGLTLSVTSISSSDSNYDPEKEGKVVSQGTRSGQVLNGGETIQVTVMGSANTADQVPNFVGKLFTEVEAWASSNNYQVNKVVVSEGITGKGGTVIEQSPAAGSNKNKFNTIDIKYYDYLTLDVSVLIGKTEADVTTWINTNLYYPDYVAYATAITPDSTKAGTVASASFGASNIGKSNDKTLVITFYRAAQNFTITANAESGGTASGSGSYSNAGTATVTATPNTGYKFVGWYVDGNLVSSDLVYTFNVTKNLTLTAKFEAKQLRNITVTSSEGGSAIASAAQAYDGDVVTITATANEGYSFVSWSDGDTNPSRTITISGDINLTANFVAKQLRNITVTSSEGGSAIASAAQAYDGDVVTITATANEGYSFVSWSDGDTNPSRTITISGDINLTATFIMNPAPEPPASDGE